MWGQKGDASLQLLSVVRQGPTVTAYVLAEIQVRVCGAWCVM